MTGTVTDDRLDNEIRSALAAIWEDAPASAPTAEEMSGRVAGRVAARPRPRLIPAPAFLVVLGLLVLIVVGAVVIGSQQRLRLPTANGPIALGSKLKLVDPATGASVAFEGCAACTITDGDWSPDGSTLTYVDQTEPSVLWAWAFGAAEPARFWTCQTAGCVLGNPNWSPDGRSLIVDATTADFAPSAFYVIGHDGSVVRSIPSGSLRSGSFASIGSPSWLPDGRVLFTALTGGTVAVWTMAADGTDVQTVLPVEGAQAAASPDGKSIAYLSEETDWSFSVGIVERLWIFDYQGPGAQPVPRLLWQQPNCCIRLGYAGPEWSPDGTHIAFTGVASRPNQPATADGIALVTVDVVTGKATVLTQTDVTRPAWRPVP